MGLDSLMADGMTKEEIQEVVRGFGMDNNQDLVSNPKQTGSGGGIMMGISRRNNEYVHVMKKKKVEDSDDDAEDEDCA